MFRIKQPCDQCPFKKSAPQGWLGQKAEEIEEAVFNGDAPFHCHKTVDYSTDSAGELTANSQFCAGALLVMKKEGALYDNLVVLVGRAIEFFKPDELKGEDQVFDSSDEFVKHHERNPLQLLYLGK